MHVLVVGAFHRCGAPAERGLHVTRAEGIHEALSVLRTAGADLVIVDADEPPVELLQALGAEHIRTPVVACGGDRPAGFDAIGAGETGAPSAERDLIGAALMAVAAGRASTWPEPSAERPGSGADRHGSADMGRGAVLIDPALTRESGAASPGELASPCLGREAVQGPDAAGSLVGRTVAEVERDLILDTLAHCHGNRTHAARILGISIRTLRNKLNEYGMAGIAIPEPGQLRIAAA